MSGFAGCSVTYRDEAAYAGFLALNPKDAGIITHHHSSQGRPTTLTPSAR